jgi:hypothetical protein
LFNKNKTKLIEYPAGKAQTVYTVPNSVAEICDTAFLECVNLKSITIPVSVKKIDDAAFNGCTSLTSITIPNSVTSVGESAFCFCAAMKSATFAGNTAIHENAFGECDNITIYGLKGSKVESYAKANGIKFSVISAPACSTAKPSAKSNLSSIVASLKQDKNVSEYAVSHNSDKIAVIRTNAQGSRSAYVITVANKKQQLVQITEFSVLHSFIWSYNDKYLSIIDGTTTGQTVYILNASNLTKHLTVCSACGDGMVWSYGSNVAAFSVINTAVKPVIDSDLGGGTDIIIYNIDTLKYRRVIKANPQYEYNPAKWNKDGLSIDKWDIVSNKKTTLTLKTSK